MDLETFLGETQESIIHLVMGELCNLDAVKPQMTTWIRFRVEVEDGDNKASNIQMTEVFHGSNLN